jgi:predicted ATPase/DNA-binding SARP family transcriptional activator
VLSAPGPEAAAAGLEFRILGPLEVLREGSALPLGPHKQRALLALLLIDANRVVTTHRLSEELWAGRPPPGAAKTLRSYVSRLRALVGEGVVQSRSHGYVLEVDADRVDAHRFERLLGEGREARTRGDPSSAAARLREGLTLWRGSALTDFVDEPFADAEAARLEELRLEAIEERARADLECGRHAELVAELEALVIEQPLRERLWAQLMTALSRSGRPADALSAYRRAREVLVDRLGIEAGDELRDLEQKILRHELAAAPAPAPPHNLPTELTSFVGREREQSDLIQLLRDAPLVTLTGIGGCGKTRLALEVARSALADFRDGVFLVELAGLGAAELVPHAVASALKVHERSERPVLELLTERLRHQALLIVLDNCEHVLDACADVARRLLSRCPELRILATSREPLAVAGEHLYRVPPLPVGTGDQEADPAVSDAVRLFLDRAAAVHEEQKPRRESLAAIAAICRELDGLPLALELAAARTHVLTVQEVATRLDDRFRFLRYWRRSPEPRHQTLGTTMSWSYDLLAPDEQALLRRLTVFAGGFTLEAAAIVCLDADADADAALAQLTRLVDGSLVLADHLNVSTRYRMLETVRLYGAERLRDAGETDEARARHAKYFLAVAEGEWEGIDAPTGASWWTALEDGDNFRAALGWHIEQQAPEDALAFVCWLTWFWERTDQIAEGRMWCDRALAMTPHATAKARAQGLYAAGSLSWLANDFSRAGQSFDESLRLFTDAGDRLWIARVLDRIADLHFTAGELEQARESFEASLEHFEALSRPGGVAAATHGLGQVHRDLGDTETARALLSSAAAMYRERDDRATLAATLHSIGDLELGEGRATAAAERYGESLSLARDVGMGQRTLTYCLAGLASVAALRGEVERAGRLWGAVERREEDMGVALHHAERERYERLIARIDGAEFTEAVSAGRRLTLDQAVSLAQRN